MTRRVFQSWRNRRLQLAVLAGLATNFCGDLTNNPTASAGEPTFEGQVRTILLAKRGRCRGEDRAHRKSDLNLRSTAPLSRGGESKLTIVSGKPDHKRLTYSHDGRAGCLTDAAITKVNIVSQLLTSLSI